MTKVQTLSLISAFILSSVSSICASPDFSLSGYASVNGGVSGGKGGTSRIIETIEELVEWGKSREKNTEPEIVIIKGKISSSGEKTLITLKKGANITIEGDGTGELFGVGLNIRDYDNVIVRNLKIHEVLYPDDALTLDNVQGGWVDHCELHSKIGPGITVDTYDGLLDIKNGSSAITISWCYLHDHMKCSLVGHTDNIKQKETDSKIRVTYHHNYFANTDGRNPSLRFGAVHMFNNYYYSISDYALAARDGAHAKVESCHFEDVKLPLTTDKFPVDDLPNGFICQSGNIFTGSCGENKISQSGCDFWEQTSNLNYSYTLDNVHTVKDTVKKYAGVLKEMVSTVPIRFISRFDSQDKTSKSVNIPGNSILMFTGMQFDLNGKLLNSSKISDRFIAPRITILRGRSEESVLSK